MKDWNSITVDRYYEQLKVPSTVAIGILNISRDINSDIVNKRTLDMTYFYINRMIKAGVGNYIGEYKKVEEMLEKAFLNGKKYCMVACQGLLLFRGPSLIVQSLDYADKNPNFFVIAHIMDKQAQHYLTNGAYPGLHRQYLFVNLDTWVKLGKPSFDEIGLFWDRKQNLRNYKLSKETIHSNYTPSWIEGMEGSDDHSITSDGSNWIDIACKNNIRIDNLDNDMRACKVFLYPYSDTKELESVWYNKQSPTVDKLTNQSQRGWIRKLAYQEEIEKDRVYAFNTETLSSEGVRTNKPIDALFSAAAGFKPLAILNANGFHEGTQIHYFDWCEASLKYKKHLLETWNGYDLHEWLLEHDLEYNFASTYRGNYESYWQQEVAEHGGREAFKTLWDRYKNLKHEFHMIDIVNDPHLLFEKINSIPGTKVLWTTNIWSSEMLHWNVEPEVLEEKWKIFESLIPKDLILYGHDYVAVDINERVRNGKQTTHPRFYMNDDEIYWDNLYVKKGYSTRWSTSNIQPCLIEYLENNSPTNAIDIGCGDGFQTNYITQFCKTDGLELSNEAVKLGQEKYPNVNFIYKDILEYTTDTKYDFIFDRGFFHTANKYSYTSKQFVQKIFDLITDNGTWLSIIGSADRVPEDPDTGPPRWTAKQIIDIVEPYFNIISLKQTYLETDGIQKTAWSLKAQKRLKHEL